MEFVSVKGGCYQMGNAFDEGIQVTNEKPVHEVCVDDFYIGKYDVTVGDFRKFVSDTGYTSEAEKGKGCWHHHGDESVIEHLRQDDSTNWKYPGFNQDDRHPVVCMSWNDAKAYADWMHRKSGKTVRLPTEAEWEYAARSGGKTEKYAGGNDMDSLAWYKYNSGSRTHPVGTKRPNGLGLYDMSGNVCQWVADWYAENYSESPRNNPTGPRSGQSRVIRGSAWADEPIFLHVTRRSSGSSADEDFWNTQGFRMALSPAGGYSSETVEAHQSKRHDEAKHPENDPGVDMCYVKSPSLSLRSEPSVGSFVIKKLRRGNSLVLLSRESVNGWFNVIDIASGEEGWVKGTSITIKRTENPREANPFQAEKIAGLKKPEILITNDSYKDMKLTIGPQVYKVNKHTSITISHDAGTFDYHASAPGVLPALGKNTFKTGYRYTWRFWIATK